VPRSTDGTRIVAGASLGGVWRAGLDGTGWTPLGDGVFGGAHHVVVLPPDAAGGPDVMLTSPTWRNLVYRSADDGVTWDAVGGIPAELVGVRRMVADADGLVWLVGVSQSGSTVYRSSDAGRSFEAVLQLGAVWGDLWVPRDGSSADVWAIGQRALFRSIDGGDSWIELDGPATLDTARIAGSEATDPPRLYVGGDGYYGGNSADLYVSTDGGTSWAARPPLSDHWEVLVASTLDPDLLTHGGVDLYRSTDGGQSFARLNRWDEYYADPLNKLHADMMAVTVLPEPGGGETWYIGCHGGVYESTSGLQRVRNLSMSGLRVSQYYSSLTSARSSERVLAGAQDQGLQWTAVAPAIGEQRFDFEQVVSGDYGHLVSSDGTTKRVYGVYPGFILTFAEGTPVGEPPVLDYLDFPSDPVRAPWLPFLAPDPLGERDAFLYAGSFLWRYSLDEDRWERVHYSEQSFTDRPGEWLSAFALSPADPELGVAITSYGDVFRSTDRGVTWEARGTGPVGAYYYGAAVLPSHRDASVWYLGGSGYDGPSVYRSTDGGLTFEPWDDGMPPTLVFTLVELRDGTGRVLAGTENAAFMRDPSGGEWVDVTGAAAPLTNYWSAEVLQDENTVRFATYGRGLWDLRLDPQGEGCFATQDADGDGVLCEDDCDDGDPDALPGAPERCDGVDTDCDGLAEPDGDGDGAFDCDGFDDADPDVVDCDDAEPAAAPGLPELACDGIDNDCDGSEFCVDLAEAPAAGGCGCGAGGGGGGGGAAAAMLALVGLATRRRRRSGPAEPA
jgi:MYXO-CTERM domain-containing protein